MTTTPASIPTMDKTTTTMSDEELAGRLERYAGKGIIAPPPSGEEGR